MLWAESHDTYMGSSGSSAFSNTKDISNDKINKAWAIVASRADSTALFFARPNSVMGAASTDTNWKSPVVAAVNKFKNHFNGTNEYLASKNSDVAYVERGTKGVVICKLTGDNNVSLTAHQMEDGTYTDQITGNTFTVSNGTISGTVGDTGVAVVYNTDESALNYIEESTLYLKPNSNWTQASARFAMYVYNSVTGARSWASMTSAGSGYYSADVPSGDWTNVIFVRMNPSSDENRWDAYDGEGHVWNQTNDLFPDDGTNCYTIASGAWSKGDGTWSSYSSQTTTAAPTTVAPTTVAPTTVAPTTVQPTTAPPSSNTYTIYAINNANWSKIAVHYWGDGETDWPGTTMTSVSGTKVYSFQVPKNVSGIVFTNGASSSTKQTGDITSGIADGATWIIGSASSNNYPVSVAPDYYLVGTMNNWTNNNNYKFSISANSDGKLEYKLSGVQLAANAEFKVHSSSDSWYPSGSNHSVDAAGTYDIYFRPNGDGGSDWHESYFYVNNVTQYTITWKDGDGNTLKTDTVTHGDTPAYTGDTPTKTATAQYTYSFNNTWSPSITAATADATYTAQFDSTVNKYTITFQNQTGTVLQSSEVAYGETPVYAGETPTIEATAQYTFTFSGWDSDIVQVTGPKTYVAQYSSTVNKYNITWKDGNGETLKTEQVAYGDTPAYSGETPTKTATDQYTYTFNNTWSPEIVSVTQNATYTAQFDSTVNKYTVTWKDGDGETLKTEEVAYGDTPAYSGTTPTKTATDQYTYTFNNTWSPEIVPVTNNATYTAQFTETVNEYTIRFVNENGTELQSSQVAYGETPVYNGAIPTKEATAQYTYAFDGWDSEITSVTGNKTYTATFSSEVNVYPVTWKNYNGDTIKTYYYEYGETPVFTDTEPTRQPTAEFSYEFTGWTPEIQTVTGDAEYTAVFSKTTNTYTVSWLDYNGDELETDEDVPYGTVPEYNGETPTRTADAQYTYAFTGWSPAIDVVTGNASYTAQYTMIINTYTVTWNNYNGTELSQRNWTYGSTPTYSGDTPTKPADDDYHYTFAGWTPAVTSVTGNATYTAQFDSVAHSYGGPDWTWSNDNTAATATFTCSCGHTEIIDADVELSFSEGKEIYTAKVTFNNTEYSDSKTFDRQDLVAGHSLTLGSDIGTNFFLNPTPEELEQGITVSFEWGDKTTEPITPAYDSAYGLYKITCDVAPAEMTYDISATIRIGDSETKVDVYSPLDYADYVLNNAEYIAWVTETYSEDYYNDLKDMCLAMLDYGARAQIRFDRNAESDETLANGGRYTYDNSELTWESHASDMTANLENYGLTYVGSTVIYLYKTSLRHYYKITDPGLFAQYAGSITMDGSPIEYGERSGMIYFEVPEIAIYELDVQHTLTIGTNSYKYSATDYFAKLIETSQNEDAKELAKATYRYHLMAKEFFG